MADMIQDLFLTLVVVAAGATLLGLLGLALLHRRLLRLRVPPHAGLATTLRMVPLALVVVLDLLDLGLDVFATPLVWVILSRYRLQALRNTAAIEAFVPMTQVIPTLTLAWFGVRLLRLGEPALPDDILDAEEVSPGRYAPRAGRH